MKKIVVSLLLVLVFVAPLQAQRTKLTHTIASVGNGAATTVLAASGTRNFLILQNDSTNDIYCSFGVVAIANKGIRLIAGGGSLMLSDKFSSASVSCISILGAANNLLVTEGVQ